MVSIKHLYAGLCVLGGVLPLAQFIPWLDDHGLSLPLMWEQIGADRLSSFAWLDVLFSGMALIVFVLVESRRIGMQRGWLSLLGLGVGVSLALPLFLWMREVHLQRCAGSVVPEG